ncbi:hypothetical protein A5780_30990 [Nocardia sp. 852002-20019_SCH5090214]|nr:MULTISPECIES: hypothetical protein [Nocardia]MBV7702562.1 hypothetical protein [Nocardia nova]OBA50735.1 hypothetical protein A5780_30990 [Nocardia sp. 852002-20019_SCH5090214]PPI95875.1 hypothetical protein C5E46_18595 [Nocardia nova]
MSTATTRSGSIAVETTEQGLPLRISIEASELRREPAELAAELLRLCSRAADRAGLARRRQLAEAGLGSDLLALTGLPTAEQVERQELIDEQEYDTEPQSWLRSVEW